MNCKKNVLSALLVTSVLLLSVSCERYSQDGKYTAGGAGITLSANEIAPVSMTGYTKSDYNCFFKVNGYAYARLEPENGCYLGSYVLSNSYLEYDADRFDAVTGKRHALSVYNMRLGDEFPYEWVLECAGSMKTPYIIVRPPDEYSVFPEAMLETAAEAFSEVPLPIFVDFYPNPQSITRNHTAYSEFYKKARNVFEELSPNTIFVLSVDSKNVYDVSLYYPGDEYVDWVGMIMYRPLYVGGEVNLRNYMKDLQFLCAEFQREKPVIISQFAVSSYSTFDHSYSSAEASKTLREFYLSLKNEYPRVKGVNYMDFNGIQGAPKNASRDNYSVTQDALMLSAYKEAVGHEYFYSETEAGGGIGTVLLKSGFALLEDENFKYVPKSAFEACGFRLTGAAGVVIDGETYYSTEELSRLDGIYCLIDDENKSVIIEMK